MTADDVPCRALVDLMTGYLDGALDADLGRRVERHLAACPGCQSFLAQLRATIDLLGRLDDDIESQMPPVMRHALLAAYRGG